MDTIAAFEKKMREASFASLDEARKSFMAHPLAADYILGLLMDRGVMMVTEEGTVIGGYEVVEREGPENPDKPKLGPQEWKKEWPARAVLMAYLDCPDGKPSVKFRWVQKMLRTRSQPATHWITLHAIWHLMKHGLAEKSKGGYRLTEKGQDESIGTPPVIDENGGATPEDVKTFKAAVEEMGTDMVEVIDSVLGEGKLKPDCTAKDFTLEVCVYKDAGEWMDRPEMRGGFNLAFVRWAQARFLANDTIG